MALVENALKERSEINNFLKNTMKYTLLILLAASIAFFINGKHIIGSVLIGIFIIILIRPYLLNFFSGNKKVVDLSAESTIPKLTEKFITYGKYMADYKTYQTKGPQYGWVMPSRKAILLVDQFHQFNRPDIPIEMLCQGIEEDFNAYDKSEGLTRIQDQKMEARLRLLSALAQSSNSASLKNKISTYIKEAESRGVSLKDGIMTNPLPTYMI